MRAICLGLLTLTTSAHAGEVTFVLFEEVGETYDPAMMVDLENHARDLQAFFREELGYTFKLSDPPVVHIEAAHDAAWYLNTPDNIHNDPRWYRLGNIKTEVYNALGLVNFDPTTRVAVYPIARFDGHVGANFGGAWMDGDDLACIRDNGETYPYPDLTPSHCLGHVAHEMGHVFGLDHTGPNDDCMRWGFYDTTGGVRMCFFDDANRQQILNEPANTGFLTLGTGQTCGDQRADCAVLVQDGTCSTDPLMPDDCEASCGTCPDGRCVDEHPTCAFWASIGECEANPGYMLPSCSASCGVCSDCSDLDMDGVCDPYDLCDGPDSLGDLNVNGVCDPSLSAEVVGREATLEITGAEPSSVVVVLGTARGTGAVETCHPSVDICTTLERPMVLARLRADADGDATWSTSIPASVPSGTELSLQAAWLQGANGDVSSVRTLLVP